MTQEWLPRPVPTVLPLPALTHTHPFQEWHSAILATRIRAKKIWNFSSKHKWKDERDAKQRAPRFSLCTVKCHFGGRNPVRVKWTRTGRRQRRRRGSEIRGGSADKARRSPQWLARALADGRAGNKQRRARTETLQVCTVRALVNCPPDTTQSHPRQEFQSRQACRRVYGRLSWWLAAVGGLCPWWAAPFPDKDGQGCIRKPAEHIPVSKPARRVPAWVLLQLPAWLPGPRFLFDGTSMAWKLK